MTPNVLQQKLFDLAVECEKMSKEEISKALVALSNAKLDQALTIQGKDTALFVDCSQDGNGLDIFVKDTEGTVLTGQIRCKQKHNTFIAKLHCNPDQPDYTEDVWLPGLESRSPVVMTESGRLYCIKCRCWVPNTANTEMRKEGCYAHSHICGHRQSGEIYGKTKGVKML